jgi:type I restriction enzyme S subunit
LESQWKKDGIPFYRAREIVKLAKDGHVDNDVYISQSLFHQLSAQNGAPKPGDLMVSAVGTLGACYLVRPGDRFYFKDASVLRFIPQGAVEPAFVQHAFRTRHMLRQVQGGSGSTVGTYTIARARDTRLYLPPLELQRRFKQILECLESQSVLHKSALSQSESLFASLQHRAFHGAL